MSGCASSELPGWCTPWSNVCSGKLGVGIPLREWKQSAVMDRLEGAGGWTADDAREQRGCHSSCCSVDSGRCSG